MDTRPGSTSAAFVSVTTLFFAWGFITSHNNPLIASLKSTFDLSYNEALMTQLVSFAACGLTSLPAASLINRIGPTGSILAALATMIAGCLLMPIVTRYQSYPLILCALFLLGMGITALQVAANPLAAALGSPERSHYRLTIAQAFNSLGVVVGVNFGSALMLDSDFLASGYGAISSPAGSATALAAVTHAFLFIAAMLGVLMVFILRARRRIELAAAGIVSAPGSSAFEALRSRWALFGAVAIALYVGAEVSIASIMINFLNEPQVLGLPLKTAGFYLANIYWMGALIGRFIGSWLLTRVAAPRLLGVAGAIASLLCLTVAVSGGHVAAYAALGVGIFNSIMFPTIFTITLERAGVSQSSTSGLLCFAIVGGAALPYAVGKLADSAGITIAFLMPMAAYALIFVFARLAIGARVYHGESAPAQAMKVSHV